MPAEGAGGTLQEEALLGSSGFAYFLLLKCAASLECPSAELMASSELRRHLIWLPVSSRASMGRLPGSSLVNPSGAPDRSMLSLLEVAWSLQDSFLLDHPYLCHLSKPRQPVATAQLSSEMGIPALRVSRAPSPTQGTGLSSQQRLPPAAPAPPGPPHLQKQCLREHPSDTC